MRRFAARGRRTHRRCAPKFGVPVCVGDTRRGGRRRDDERHVGASSSAEEREDPGRGRRAPRGGGRDGGAPRSAPTSRSTATAAAGLTAGRAPPHPAHYARRSRCLGAEQPVTLEELGFTSGTAMRRARAGWRSRTTSTPSGSRSRCSGTPCSTARQRRRGREAALTLATPLMRYCDVASTHAGHVFADCSARSPTPTASAASCSSTCSPASCPRTAARALAQGYGIAPDAGLLAVVAVPAGALADTAAAGAALARAALGATRTLVVASQARRRASGARPRLRRHARCASASRRCTRASRGGVPLAIGVSRRAHGVAELPRAYAEARAALECVDGDGGVAALPLMSPLRYLTLSAPDTARRLVDPRAARVPRRGPRRAAGRCATRSARSPRPTSSSAWPPRACRSTRTRLQYRRAPDPGAHGPQSAPRRRPARAAHGDRAR